MPAGRKKKAPKTKKLKAKQVARKKQGAQRKAAHSQPDKTVPESHADIAQLRAVLKKRIQCCRYTTVFER